jgi:CrcB protein
MKHLMMIKDILIVGVGSFLGGSARYAVSRLIRYAGTGFPWATFAVNMLGCLLIGLLGGMVMRHPNVPSWLPLLLMTGFCGGFTTFSTFSKESLALLTAGSYLTFLLYVVGSVGLGLAAVVLGYLTTKYI